MPRPSSSVVHELTEFGRPLEDIILRVGLRKVLLGEPGPEDIVTADSLTLPRRGLGAGLRSVCGFDL